MRAALVTLALVCGCSSREPAMGDAEADAADDVVTNDAPPIEAAPADDGPLDADADVAEVHADTAPPGYAFPLTGCMVLMFDDSPSSDWTDVRPILAAHGKKGVFAVITDHVKAGSGLTVAQVEALFAEGHEIVSHTATHPKLPALTEAAQRDELARSHEYLKTVLGIETSVLVYPFGEAPKPESLLAETYTYGVGTNGAPPRLPLTSTAHLQRVALGAFPDATGEVPAGGTKFYAPTDPAKPSGAETTNGLAYYEAQALRAKKDDRLLIFMIHSADSAFDATQKKYLGELIDYADSIGLPTRTLTRGP